MNVERIKEMNDIVNAQADKIRFLEQSLLDKQTEIERLKDHNKQLRYDRKQIASEAIKKFAERLKSKLDISVCGYSTEEVEQDVFDTIDNLVKEMTEEKK